MAPPPPTPPGWNGYTEITNESCAVPPPQLPREEDHHQRSGSTMDYHPDARCELCSTHNGAKEELEHHHGGTCDTTHCIKAKNTRQGKGDGTNKLWNYECSIKPCPWRARIRQNSPEPNATYQVELHHKNNKHNHTLVKECHPKYQHGLTIKLRQIVDSYINSKRDTVLKIQPQEVYSHICEKIHEIESLRYLQVDDERDHVKAKLRNYLYYKRKSFVESKIGIRDIRNNDDLQRTLNLWELVIPDGYRKRADYESPQALADVLRIAIEPNRPLEIYDMIIVNLTCGSTVEKYRDSLETTKQKSEFKEKMEQACFAVSPSSLWQLMHFCLRREGTRHGVVDGTGGTCDDSSTLIIFGTHSVRYRVTSKEGVTSSYRALAYLHAGGERVWAHELMLYSLRDLAKKLFGVDFVVDWGGCDHSETFLQGYKTFQENPTRCDLLHHGKLVCNGPLVRVDLIAFAQFELIYSSLYLSP